MYYSVNVRDLSFVAFDIETTGLEPLLHRIVEIGGIKFRDNQVIESFDTLIDPQIPIPEDTVKIHGITDTMVKGKPTVEEVRPDFIAFIKDSVPVAHNAPFDVSFLAYDISRLQLKTQPVPILDTCSLSRSLFPGFPSHSLQNLARQLHIVSRIPHRALSDAEICMKLFNECIRKLGQPDKMKLKNIIRHSGPVFCFDCTAIQFREPYRMIEEAFREGKSVEIMYQKSSGEETTRKITPLSVGIVRKAVILEAFCHLRQEKRTFRLDRIVRVRNLSG